MGANRFYLRRIDINKGGYDSDGIYFGIGKPLYYFTNGLVYDYLRATDRGDAISKVKDMYPGAVFFRGGYQGRS
jgi:hypothetical protein